jgi:Ferritin-like
VETENHYKKLIYPKNMKMINLRRLKITNPNQWTKDELYTNLQAAVDVELWTIPLYLTALYSIQNLNSGNQQNYPQAAKLIESVVIEEMLHLQLASNVCNALGYSPKMNFPGYSKKEGIPFLKATVPTQYQGYQVQLGGLNLNQLKLFCVIELPEPQTTPDWSKQTKYNSIGELYQALEIAVTNLWSSLYVGDANNTKQQANFSDYLAKFNKGDGFSQIVNTLDTALGAMQAIVGQGEGNPNGNEIPDPDQPPAEPTDPNDYDPSDFDPADSHYVKFNTIFNDIVAGTNVPAVYPLIQNPNKQQLAEQANAMVGLKTSFEGFVGQLQSGFNTAQPNGQMPSSFYSNMFNMQNMITAVWQAGAIPSFPTK